MFLKILAIILKAMFRQSGKRTLAERSMIYQNRKIEREIPKGVFCSSLVIRNQNEGKRKIVPIGYFPEHPDGAHEVTREHLEEIVANATSDIMVDMGHEALYWPGAPAYGWIPKDSLEVRDDGLYADEPMWTPDTQEMIENRKYRFLSPAYILEAKDKTGRQIGAQLYPISLVNQPYFDVEIDALRNSKAKEEESDNMKYSKEMREKLGMAEDATDEEVDAKLDELVKLQTENSNGSGNDNGNEGASDDDADKKEQEQEAEVVANSDLMKRLDAIERQREADREAQLKADAEALVNSAIEQGKILPAEKKVWLNSAIADLAETRATLDARKKNSALPKRVVPPAVNGSGSGNGNNASAKGNKMDVLANCTDYFRAAGRKPAE